VRESEVRVREICAKQGESAREFLYWEKELRAGELDLERKKSGAKGRKL
jgi:hypothetical protein